MRGKQNEIIRSNNSNDAFKQTNNLRIKPSACTIDGFEEYAINFVKFVQRKYINDGLQEYAYTTIKDEENVFYIYKRNECYVNQVV